MIESVCSDDGRVTAGRRAVEARLGEFLIHVDHVDLGVRRAASSFSSPGCDGPTCLMIFYVLVRGFVQSPR